MSDPERPAPDRFRPHAARELGGMFDDVSGRYDLLNRVMSLGQDGAWRAALARAVPERSRTVLDLCTGSGVSLAGLRRPGRLVLGIDVSLGMLALAAERQGPAGWAPRLVCADAFRLPLADRALDAVTVAFGVRNLRPLPEALAELARVLRPGGVLAVLEAAAPAPGPLAPFHTFYLRHLVPLAGRLSPDPSAYRYLSRSVFEFGAGPGFERALLGAGFGITDRQSFLAGATRLWVAERSGLAGQFPALPGGNRLQNARPGGEDGVKLPSRREARDREWRLWTGVQAGLGAALTLTFVLALGVLLKWSGDLPLAGWNGPLAWFLVLGGLVGFAVRTALLLLRLLGPPPRP